MNYKTILAILGICFPLCSVSAQQQVPFDEANWEFEGEHQLTTYLGQPAVLLEKGKITLKETTLRNGIIRYKVAFTPERGFVGIHVRMKDAANYEEFYMRAHQSGNPDAMQYTPVHNGIAGWQIHVGEGYSGAHHFQFDRWMEVKLVLNEEELELFIDDMETPVLYANTLEFVEAGGIALYSAVKEAYFADFRIESKESPQIVSGARQTPEPEPGTILSWQVSSEAFDYGAQEKVRELPSGGLLANTWVTVEADYLGLTNLAKAGGLAEGKNARWATYSVEADSDQIVKMDIGYSDAVLVYVNGILVYGGSRIFRSRDYRYLGTIGYFDQLYLPLREGKNEIVCAVGESMGGWAIQAKLTGLAGKVME